MGSIQLPEPLDVTELLTEDDAEYDWLIPSLLERGDRLIVTGNEGKGKSTLLRQFATQVAQGCHPFTLEEIEPRRVLVIDLENPIHLVTRKFRELNPEAKSGYLYVARWPQGLDLSHPDFKVAVTEILGQIRPDFIIGGPMYKMSPKLEAETESAQLASLIDQWRAAFRFSIILESHQPHQVITQNMRYRPERPFGSSLWMRWPEFGLCLEDDGTLRPWRGARDVRTWPAKLRWGNPETGEWPWIVDQRRCMQCGTELTGRQERFCSEKCSNAARQSAYRKRTAGIPDSPLQSPLNPLQ